MKKINRSNKWRNKVLVKVELYLVYRVEIVVSASTESKQVIRINLQKSRMIFA